MANNYSIENLPKPDGPCIVWRCVEPARYRVSFCMPGRNGERRVELKYCCAHGLRFGHKYNLLEWRGGGLYAKSLHR